MSEQPKSRLPWALALPARVLLVAGAAFALLSCDDTRQEVERRAAEVIGEAATARLTGSGEGMERAADLINIPVEVRPLAEGVYQARGVGNTHMVATDEGKVVFDTGFALQAAKQRRLLQETVPDGPVTHVILSHSHADHSGGTRFWLEDGVEIVAHQEFPEEQRYLKELEPYLHYRNRTLFPFIPEKPPNIGFLRYGGIEPTILVGNGEPYRFELGGTRFEVIGTPGAEGADNLVLWLPEQKILFSGDFFGPNFPQFPNVFTMRGEKIRKPIEYIHSLNRVIALEPEMIVPSHNDPITGREKIRADLVRMRDAVQYVHDAIIAGMNAGKTVHELMAEITLPPELELRQTHGRVSWAVKSIWEYYATWFHFDSTTELYAVPASTIYPELVELAGVDALVERARRHIAAQEPVQALHLLDIALGSGTDDRAALEARRAALQILLDDAEGGLRNSYEIDWLRYRLRETEERLGAAPAAG
ncbi:MAG: MBL fold metallo-hydrolase [Deltaproteobacteria bacterium]|nr:MBL fold metallo-hydrolase [Deltaproteobacteria bacterium]